MQRKTETDFWVQRKQRDFSGFAKFAGREGEIPLSCLLSLWICGG
jgi:hypothetical protein